MTEPQDSALIARAESIGLTAADVDFMATFADPEAKGEPGFITDFCGSRVRTEYTGKWGKALDGALCKIPIPASYTGEGGEWFGTLKGVAAASGSFSVMELGAGYGPWLGVAGVAAMKRGIKDMFICGVEGDPVRASWMKQHLIDNGLGGFPQELHAAGVGPRDGMAKWPRFEASADLTGAKPVLTEADLKYIAPFFNTSDMIDVPLISLTTLLLRRPKWDLVHMDVQGVEFDMCRSCSQLLSQRVRYMVIGTHSRAIDGQLIELFLDHGWDLEYEKAPQLTRPVRPITASVLHHTVVDGVQVWRNPVVH